MKLGVFEINSLRYKINRVLVGLLVLFITYN